MTSLDFSTESYMQGRNIQTNATPLAVAINTTLIPSHHLTMMAWTVENLASLEEAVTSSHRIALLRISLLKENNGFAALFAPLLKNALDSWLISLERLPNRTEEEKKEEEGIQSESLIDNLTETHILRRVLQVHVAVSRLDKSLGEELGRQGSHAVLSRLMRYDGSVWEGEEDQDTIMELQDLACEVAASGAFPLKVAPFQVVDLKCRLPLQFDIHPVHASDVPSENFIEPESQLVLINQVTERQSAQEDVGFVMWPSAVALSRWLVSNPHIVQGRSVLELGAGCGLTGLVAAGLLPSNVVLTDFNRKVLENLSHNIALNNIKATAIGLDFYQQHGDYPGWIDTEGKSHLQVHVILAADMICQPADAVAAAKTIHDALLPDGLAVVVCAGAKHRFGIDHFESECHRMELSVQTFNVADLYDGQLVNKDMGMTTGYVDGMKLTMFQIEHA